MHGLVLSYDFRPSSVQAHQGNVVCIISTPSFAIVLPSMFQLLADLAVVHCCIIAASF